MLLLQQVTMRDGLRHSFASYFLKHALLDVKVVENIARSKDDEKHKLVGMNVVSNATVTRLIV